MNIGDPDAREELVRLRADARIASRLSAAGCWVAIGLLAFAVVLLAILPVPKVFLVRDAFGGVLVCVAAWLLFLVARGLERSFPRSGSAFASSLTVLLVLGGGAILVVIVSSVAIAVLGFGGSADVGPLLVPVLVVLALAGPSAYVMSTAVRLRALERRYGTDGVAELWTQLSREYQPRTS